MKEKKKKFNVTEWSRAQSERNHLGLAPNADSTYALVKRKWLGACLVEVVGRSENRVYGFSIESGKRTWGMSGDTSGSFNRSLVCGYANNADVFAEFPSIVDADSMMCAFNSLTIDSEKDEIREARSAAYDADLRLTRKRRDLIEEATKKIDEQIATESADVRSLSSKANMLVAISSERIARCREAIITSLGGKVVSRSLLLKL
jgi:hypothetical protein